VKKIAAFPSKSFEALCIKELFLSTLANANFMNEKYIPSRLGKRPLPYCFLFVSSKAKWRKLAYTCGRNYLTTLT